MKVLMIGPARDVKGGMTTVVDNYFDYGLDKKVKLKYIETVNDKNKFLKFIKMMKGYIAYLFNINNYDIVHIHMASRMSTFRKSLYIRSAYRRKKKIIVHIHGGGFKKFFDEECNYKKKKYITNVLNKADKLIVLSEEWKEYFSNIVDIKKIVVINNAVFIPENFEKNIDNKKILYIGRIEKSKGIYDLLEAMKEIRKIHNDAILYIAGAGEENKIRNVISNSQLENNVKLLGWIDGKEKEQIQKESSICVLPSYYEGMPMSLIECMAYKEVIVATDVGGIPELIKDGINGVLVKAGNIKLLVKKINKVLDNDIYRKRLSENARRTVEEKYDIQKEIKKLIELYISV